MKIKELILVLLVFGAIISIKAQEVVSSSGNYQETSTGSLSWTIGETITETVTNGNILTQGFHQSRITVTNITEINTKIDVSIFPNPTNEFVKIISSKDENYKIQLFNINGKLLVEKKINNTDNRVNMNKFTNGTYLLKVTNKNRETNTYQIIKQ